MIRALVASRLLAGAMLIVRAPYRRCKSERRKARDHRNVAIEYLVGWPRVEIGKTIMDWPQLKLIAAEPARKDVPGEELVWIEDKVLHSRFPTCRPATMT